MDSRKADTAQTSSIPAHVPEWASGRLKNGDTLDAAFAAGAALRMLDDLVRSNPLWLGCWRERQALRCAQVACRQSGSRDDEAALRDALLLTAKGDDPGPAGRVYVAFRNEAKRKPTISTKSVTQYAEQLGLRWDEDLASCVEVADDVLQSGRAAPIAVARFVTTFLAKRPDAENLAWLLADQLVAMLLKWERAVPLFMAERNSAPFRSVESGGRVRPGDDAFVRAVCLALVSGVGNALRSAGDISRRADTLLGVAPKLRTKGAAIVIQKLLEEDAVLASAPGTDLSRWAATRLFDRLTEFGAVRELSGRSSFRIYGL